MFRENFDRRIVAGMLAILAGAIILSWPGDARLSGSISGLSGLGACLAWAIDNNLTRKVALSDATWIPAVKGLCAGGVNLSLALLWDARFPSSVAAAMAVGLLAYGVSLALFVVGLRHLGTARTGAYFWAAPFFGALLALTMGEPVTPALLFASALMAIGVWLHLTERHEHWHLHEALEHAHPHVHDEQHRHACDGDDVPRTHNSHVHRHEPLRHTHTHFPDAHHHHDHWATPI